MVGLLADTATADGNYPSASGVRWNGGTGTLAVYGTFDSATAKLQCKSPNSSTWVDVGDDVSFTEAGVGAFQLGSCYIRVNIAGGGGSLSLSADCF